ncbi:hypothetical protein PANI_CDS0078 [Maribacter phage Panino]
MCGWQMNANTKLRTVIFNGFLATVINSQPKVYY